MPERVVRVERTVGSRIRDLVALLGESKVVDLVTDFGFLGVRVEGVEVTQAIQYRGADQHLTDPADRGPDNSVRLVADKPAYVRVYVHSLVQPVAGVTGTVTVQRRRYGIWSDAGALTQQAPATVTATADATYDDQRGRLASSLNFVIPASAMLGRFRLKVAVNVPGRGLAYRDETTVDVDASLLQTLRVRGIPVRYDGPDAAGNQVRLPAPTLAEFQATAATTLQMWPVAKAADITLAGTFTQNAPLTGAIVGGACPTAWNDLLFWLGIAKALDGNAANRLYYALLPSGIPIGGAAGCGGGGTVGAGRSGDGPTMAHELGHVLGFGHAPCGLGAGDMGDSAYPAYEPYDTTANRTASIGEYGLDTSSQWVHSPRFAKDFMSYCGPQWISLYHYRRLLENATLDPTLVSSRRDDLPPFQDGPVRIGPRDRPDPPPPWVGRRVRQLAEPDLVPLVVVTGVFDGGRIDVRSVLRLATGPTAAGTRIKGTVVELLDDEGDVLSRAPLRQLKTQGCGCADGTSGDDEERSGVVQALLPDPGRGTTLRVVRGDEELWARRAPSKPPAVRRTSVTSEDDQLRVKWSTSAADDHPTERFVRSSGDDGRTWDTLAVGLDEDQLVVPLRTLTSGQVLVQVIISDGFSTVCAEPVGFEVPARDPEVAVLSPSEAVTVRSDCVVRLLGAGTASDGRPLRDDELRWELDDEVVGTGPEVWAEMPGWDGEHRVRLVARDGDRWAEACAVLVSTASGLAPRQRDC